MTHLIAVLLVLAALTCAVLGLVGAHVGSLAGIELVAVGVVLLAVAILITAA